MIQQLKKSSRYFVKSAPAQISLQPRQAQTQIMQDLGTCAILMPDPVQNGLIPFLNRCRLPAMRQDLPRQWEVSFAPVQRLIQAQI